LIMTRDFGKTLQMIIKKLQKNQKHMCMYFFFY
jgi:hypothetical protein